MSTFVSVVSPTTGRTQWIMQKDDYDYTQEVARSAYADMLHDKERNEKYYLALKQAVKLMKEKGKEVNVLDIGTGTGLLSMMAARCGADSVTAIEAFRPMAECALKIIEQNGLSHVIKVIKKRSTEVTLGPGCDMPRRANILVTEVFDTELIGEGAISTFQHAHDHLLEDDCYVIPNASTVYAQLVESDLIYSMHHLQPIQVKDSSINPPKSQYKCTGAASLHDIQMDQLSTSQFRAISDPMSIFKFDFSGKERLKYNRHCTEDVASLITGKAHAVFMWWDIVMDPLGQIILSCAPHWGHPEPESMPWRDHWMQAVYYLQRPLDVSKGDAVTLHGFHDEYSLWFHAANQKEENTEALSDIVPTCNCGVHVAYSRTHIGMMNDVTRQEKYISSLENVVTNDTVCFSLTDGSFLPFICAKLGCTKVFTIENSIMSNRIMQTMITENNMQEKISILNTSFENITSRDLNDMKIDVLVGEPSFLTSLLPWHNLFFWYARTALSEHLSTDATISPRRGLLKAVAVQFKDLWKIRAPVGDCEGFNIEKFDELILNACNDSDSYIEPQPLWEYPCNALSDVVTLQEFDFTKPVADLKLEQCVSGTTKFKTSGMCNGVAVWMDWQIDEVRTVTTGPVAPVIPGQKIEWDMYTRQGVHLFRSVQSVKPEGALTYQTKFMPESGEVIFNFEINN